MQLHSSGLLAGGWAHLHSWKRQETCPILSYPLSLSAGLPPQPLHSMRTPEQRPKRASPQGVGPYQNFASLLADGPLAKANHKAKVRMKVGEECKEAWMSEHEQSGALL